MNYIYRLSSILLLTSLLAGCTTQSGPTFPHPEEGYVPKRVYDVSFDKVWKAVNDALDENRIAVIFSDQAAGRIQTDYVPGTTTAHMGFLGGVGSSRYSYNVKVSRDDTGKTKILILGKLEQTLHGHHSATPYRDISAQNQAIVTKLEDWLYAQIEKRI